ncbi:MAG TPA: hypothetical protein VIR57_07110, partial [Chloroflexota bacterium]
MCAHRRYPLSLRRRLRSTNLLESVFDGVRLRTNAARRMHVRENALFLVFKLVHRLSLNWRAINAPNQLLLLLHGHRFVNGRIHLPESSKKEDIAA